MFDYTVEAGRVIRLGGVLQHQEPIGDGEGIGEADPVKKIGAGLSGERGQIVGGEEAAVGVTGKEDDDSVVQSGSGEFLGDDDAYHGVAADS